jgi:hypothetical protein
MSDRYELENALLRVETAARDWHDEHCGCEGEACPIGDALARLDAKRDAIRARQQFERGGVA